MGFKIDFSNLYRGEIGLKTSRGVANYRAIQASYQAWRIVDNLDELPSSASVLEIGAGLGRTAYYVMKMGVGRYTIIDLPLTNVSPGCFLGSTLGAHAVALHGETRRTASVKIKGPICSAMTRSILLLLMSTH
ncbi:hypothetical protein [Bradyrhizobium sp. WSM1253]|uniref:hypothetical protein n=1 Tax=Bradyrhizobium sp. WSM1253 TaxID=319003 RepID=UPI0012F4CE90|nr:hypothetical protein [Bradyrhizobium sp. WSM1253]